MAYNTSSGYKTVIYSGDSNNKLLLKFNNVELENADIYCEKITVKSSILPNGSNRFSLENFISKEVEIILHDVDINSIVDQVYIAIGTFVDSAYEYVPIGIFNIQDKPETDGNKITITLRDNAVKFDFNYNAKTLFDLHGGTATKLQILQDMCIIAGVECDITSFLGSTDLIGIYDSSIKARKYISYLAGQAGMISTIDRDGKLIFIDIKNLTTKVIPLNIVEKYENGIPYKISKTIYESGIIKYESGTTDNDFLYLDSANPYITTQGQVDSIHSLVSGFEINSLKTGKILGDPSIDAYDLISITDGLNTYITLATNTLVYQKSMIQTFDTQISLESRETNVSLNSDATFKKYAKTNIDNINAQIEIIAGEVIDLSANANGLGNVILTNCSKTPLYKLSIKNACQLFPSVNLFPSSTTFLKSSYLRITHEDNTYERYLLPTLALRIYDNVSDELIIENNKVSIIKRVGVNIDESLYVLTTPITTTYDDIILYLNEGTNTVWLESFPNATLEITYLLKNKYTDVFATQADVSGQITVASEEINIEVDKKVNENEIISRINLSPEEIAIQSNKIRLEGLTTINDGFSVDLQGNSITNGMTANDIKIVGGNITLEDTGENSDPVIKIFDSTLPMQGFLKVGDDLDEKILVLSFPNDGEIIDSLSPSGTWNDMVITDTGNYIKNYHTTAETYKEYVKVVYKGIETYLYEMEAHNILTNFSSYQLPSDFGEIIEVNNHEGITDYITTDNYSKKTTLFKSDGIYINDIENSKICYYGSDGIILLDIGTFSNYGIEWDNGNTHFDVKNDKLRYLCHNNVSNMIMDCTGDDRVLDNFKIILNSVQQLNINQYGVFVVSLTQTSREEDKKNFEKFDNALNIIKDIDIYKYHMKEQDDQDKKHIGFVIGDSFNYSKEITSENNDGVDLYSMVSLCMKAIKEQQEQIEELKKEIKFLKESDK